MKKIICSLLCLLPISAMAGGVDEDFASRHRFYIGGTYNLSWWQDYATDTELARGKTEYGYDAIVGARLFNTFRLEADYMHSRAKWDVFAIDTDTVFFNAIVDARIDEKYHYNQHIGPYVGVGTGITWYDSKDVETKNDMNVSLAALAGIGFELGEYFALDIGYRYIYMFKPNVDTMPELNPSAHQVRAGARINF